MFLVAGLRGAGLGDANRLAIDGSDDALPTGQGFFEAEFNGCNEVVTFDLEVWVIKLLKY